MTSNEPHQPAVSNSEQGGFTPGPWFVGEVTMVNRDTGDERPDPNHTFVSDDGGAFEASIISGDAAADARLIAAAPELLFVLENVVSLYETHKVPKDLAEAGWRNIDTEWVKQARAAIAKARGQITSAVRNAAE